MSERLKIGEGRISGALSLFLSLIGLGAVLCFHFPQLLTTAEFRAHYPVELLRVVLLVCLVLAFGFALLSFLLAGASRMALGGVLLTALAVVLAFVLDVFLSPALLALVYRRRGARR